MIPVFQATGEDPRIESMQVEKVGIELAGTATRGMTFVGPRPLYQAVNRAARNARPWAIEHAAGKVLVSHRIDADALKEEYVARVFDRE